MTFNPLGAWSASGPLNTTAIASAVVFYRKLPILSNGFLDRMYNHWTVGHYDQDFSDYNACIRFADGHFFIDLTHDPLGNATGDEATMASHTYRRNSHAFGISTDDMVGATQHDFGPEPLTVMTLEFLCAANAAAAMKYGIDLAGKCTRVPFVGEPNLLTHAEAANTPGSPPLYANYYVTGERWDLASEAPLPDGMTTNNIDPSVMGNAIRARSHDYKLAVAKALAA